MSQAINSQNVTETPKGLNIVLWVVQVGASGMFLMAGGSKLAGAEQMVGMFQAIGFGQWFRYLTGGLEVIGAALLLIPALSGVGGLLLTGVMIGAVATHLFIIGGNPTPAIVLLIASAFVAWSRRRGTLALLERYMMLTRRDKNFVWRRVDARSLDLKRMKVAIVGGTGGIGRALSRFVASRGANVIVVGRTFRDADVPGIAFIEADLSLMHEARRVGDALPAETLDIVIFTTGIFAAPKRQETVEGIELDMAVSYLSRLVILRAIAPRLGKNRPAESMKPRVFVMGFPGAGQIGKLDDLNSEKSYASQATHMSTVAGNEMLVLDSAQCYPNASFFGLNPGGIKSNIRSNWLGANSLKHRFFEWTMGLIAQSAETYAERLAPLLVSPDLEGHNGVMFDRKGFAIIPSPKLTGDYTSKFIGASEALVSRKSVRVA